MANVQRLTKRLARYRRKLTVAQAQGKVRRADRYLARIGKIEFKLQQANVKAGVTQIGIGRGITQVGTAGARGVPGPRKQYGTYLDKGAIKYVAPSGQVRTLGYTPATAKKKYKTRRRRPRLTARDRAILMAIQANPSAAPALVMMK